MDAKNFKKTILSWLCCCLAGCASLPSQDFQFSLSTNSAEQSTWSQTGLASAGNLAVKFRLRQSASDAADAAFKFASFGAKDTNMTIRIEDRRCSGLYSLRIEYRAGQNEFRSYHFKTAIRWDDTATMQIRWDKNHKLSVVVNGSETANIELFYRLHTVTVEVKKVGIDVEELVYRSL
jgi:hypothetical protein